jgi:tripartite-type tricarboxylate transporter receptor subunit TctC
MLMLGAFAGGVFVAGAPRRAMAVYPERPIRIVAPFPPGASNDLTARIVGAALADVFRVPVVIENRPGANGGIGSAAVARAAPDGYTLLLVPNVFEVNPLLSKQAAYDPIKDFAPIADIAAIPNVIAANPATGLKTFADLMARSRAQPDALNFSTPGVGSISHLGAELLKLRANLRLTHVPYSGAAPALQAVLAGTVQLVGITIATALPHIKAGNLIALVQTGKARWPDLPDVPTLAEEGIPDAVSETYQSLYAPAGTPRQILDWLAEATLASLYRGDVREKLKALSLDVRADGSQVVRARIGEAVIRWREVIEKSGIKSE